MTSIARSLILTAAVFVILEGVLSAQAPNDPVLDEGIRPFQTYDGSTMDSVDVETGNLSLHIPVVSFPQRGALHLSYSITYTRPYLTIINPQYDAPSYYQIVDPGVDLVNDAFRWVNTTEDTSNCGDYGTQTCAFDFSSVYDGDGQIHQLGFTNTTTQARSLDGTGFLVNFPLQSNCTIVDQDGVSTTYSTNGTATVTDPNGNQMSSAYASCATTLNPSVPITYLATSSVTDTMGRQIPATDTGSWTVPGPSNGTVTYQWTSGTNNIISFVLPDETSYTFKFTSLPLPLLHKQTTPQNLSVLSAVTLPSGGTISYSYSSGVMGSPCAGTSFAPVTARTVNANDGTGPHTWTYSYSYITNPVNYPSPVTTTVTDPLGDVSIHTFPNACFPYESQLVEKDSGGNILKTVQTTYESLNFTQNGYPMSLNIKPTSVTTAWPNGQQSKVSTTYDQDNGSSYISGVLLSSGPVAPLAPANGVTTGYTTNPWSQTESDYGQGAPGAVLRTTKTQYLAFSNSAYLANNLLGLPSSVQVLDGGGTQHAYTTYGYDEVGLQSSGVTEQKVSGLSKPGNQTSIHRWLSNGNATSQSSCPVSVASGGYLVTNDVFFDTGELQQSKDPCLHSTSYLYSATYFGAFPTTLTNALGQTTTYVYDFTTGLPTSVTDANSQTIINSYDFMGRLTGIGYPDGGSKSYCYTDVGGATCSQVSSPPYSVVSTQTMSQFPEQAATATVVFDGLERVNKKQVTSDPYGVSVVDTTYDALGRLYTVSNPYRSTSDSTYGITTYSYDALGRKTGQIDSDGVSQQSWSYSGNTITYTNENGNKWQRTMDSLGRLTHILEPNGINSLPAMDTDYSYDALNDLSLATQWGGPSGSSSARIRSFTYDSLSRLVTASNPESGLSSYSYDANGNVVSKTSPAVNSISGTQTIGYCYDLLNRVTYKFYRSSFSCTGPSGQSASYMYDASSITGSLNTVGRLTDEKSYAGSTLVSERAPYRYDPMGRLLNETQCTFGNCSGATFQPAYTYDLAGNLLTLTDGITQTPTSPGGILNFTNGYDAAGRLQTITSNWSDNTHPTTLFTTLGAGTAVCGSQATTTPAYTAFGGLMNATFGNGLTLNRIYDNRLRTKCELGMGIKARSATGGSGTLTINGSEQSN